jgi:hypothetical protein
MNRRITACLSVVLVFAAASAAATGAGPADLHNGGDVHESIGQPPVGQFPDGVLQRGVVYGASAFPLAVRVRPNDGHWQGGQFESGRFRFVQLGHLRTGDIPLHGVGFITIEAAAGATPTATATIERLHATPHIDAGPIKAARVAGFAGRTFDATIVGIDHPPFCRTHSCPGHGGVSLAPFTTNLHCGFCTHTMKGETQDVKYGAKGQLFRITALDVRGKTVVIYVESTFAEQPRFLPAKTFPTFLPYAKQLLATLRFPAT